MAPGDDAVAKVGGPQASRPGESVPPLRAVPQGFGLASDYSTRFRAVGGVIKKRLFNFLYKLGRTIASLCGAPPQETISLEVGRHAKDNALAEKHATSWTPSKRITASMQ